MRIGELARRSSLTTSRIRFDEAHGLPAKAERCGNGYRDHPAGAVRTLRLIRTAQDLWFSPGEIRAGLSQAEDGLPSRVEMLDAPGWKLENLDRRIEEATRRRRRIVAMIEEFQRELRPAG